ncbi:hypothetical protein AAHE18_10G063900 [Arachis hypogaea]
MYPPTLGTSRLQGIRPRGALSSASNSFSPSPPISTLPPSPPSTAPSSSSSSFMPSSSYSLSFLHVLAALVVPFPCPSFPCAGYDLVSVDILDGDDDPRAGGVHGGGEIWMGSNSDWA